MAGGKADIDPREKVGASRRPAPGDDAAAGTLGTGENVCPECNGGGRIGRDPCPNCAGTGKVIEGMGGA
jgi:hypothetical protein